MATGEIQEKANEQLGKELTSLENRLINRLLLDLNLLAVNNQLVFDPDYFSRLEDKIVNYMKELKYSERVNAYLSNYDAIDEMAREFYSRQRLLLENEAINNPLNEQLRRQTIESLKGAKIQQQYIKPLADVLRVQALQGLTIAEATEQLKARMQAGELTKYAGQVTQDAIMQYDGALNKNIAVRYGLKEFIYFASIIETSRPFCTHIKKRFGSRPIKESELQMVLDEYCPNGQPSEEKETFTTVNNETRTMKKGSGMIEGTTVGNFAVNRGGYNCRHEVRYVVSGTTSAERARAIIQSLGI